MEHSLGQPPSDEKPSAGPINKFADVHDAERKAWADYLASDCYYSLILDRVKMYDVFTESTKEDPVLHENVKKIARQRSTESWLEAVRKLQTAAKKYLDVTAWIPSMQLGCLEDKVYEHRREARLKVQELGRARAFYDRDNISDEELQHLIPVIAKESWITWSEECAEYFTDSPSQSPSLPIRFLLHSHPLLQCECRNVYLQCKHQMRWTFYASGNYSTAWLIEQSLPWHPGTFAGPEKHRVYAQNMYGVIQELIADLLAEQGAASARLPA